MISLGSPLLHALVVTPHGNYGADRPLRHGTHLGLDFAAKLGDQVVAAAPGTVARHGFDPPVAQGGHGGGNYVITRAVDGAGNVFELGYMHLSKITTTDGQSLAMGDSIGTAGATGTADGGVHLHFQLKHVEKDGTKTAVDPTALMQSAIASSSPKRSTPVGPLVAIAGGIYSLSRWFL